ncbi:MAG: hypothetical protein C0481_19210 [Phenylobacterium sp.]|uniref:calcium-binding protein n=1 Tax=Phenylobacterium sp. TaxID=1871053 RepID=UPI0025F0D279|nr:calcium-binding protein [Phenylobacterium sp.]MBA4013997.1 hypothetical protein [Phenylobacterium sp.]
MSLSATINFANLTGWAYDASRNAIHMTGAGGLVRTWSLDSDQFTGSFQVGGAPSSLDITVGDGYLLVGNGDVVSTGNSSGPLYAAEVARVNLAAGTVEKFQVTLTDGGERGVNDLAIGADNEALITTNYSGSAWVKLRKFQVDAATPEFKQFPGSTGDVVNHSFVAASEDRRYILFEEGKIGNAPLRIYDTVSNVFIAETNVREVGANGFNAGKGDISTAAGLVSDVLRDNVFIFDLQLKLVADLTSFTVGGSVVGAEFNDGGHQLFLWQGPLKSVQVIDTLTWKQVGSFDVTSATKPADGIEATPHGDMDVIAGGRGLVLDFGAGLEVIDLASKLKIEITGDATGEILHGAIGADRLLGEGGADTISGYEGQDFIRGGEGDDLLMGGKDFDDLHGNQGNDTVRGGQGDDWVVGGQGHDLLFGDLGNDLVFGNMGADTCEGGAGNDTIRGGQDGDLIFGGDGDDWISGDLGNDTLSGGAGADTFNIFAGSGVDRVTDFSAAEGDRIRIEGGVTTYTVVQQGADAVVTVGDAQVVLVGVQASSLSAGSIFVA